MDDKRRLTGVVASRLVVVFLFFVSTILLMVNSPATVEDWAFAGLFKLVVATLGFSLLTLLYLKCVSRPRTAVAYFQIIWDLLFVTVLLLFTGGIASPYSFLYLLSVMTASVLLARKQAIHTASLCAILYGGITDLQYYGALDFAGLSRDAAIQHGEHYIFYNIFINIVGFYLTALLTGYLAERARKSEKALEEKVIDYEELESLNSAIVGALDSGLLTLNQEGKIRVFNPSAERLLGLDMKQVYDRRLDEVFPLSGSDAMTALRRKEITLSVHDEPLTLAFTLNRLYDKPGRRNGIIINFRDVTELHRMEEALKRADRLAAVGALSARIAHEIRNPLASISGSAQLLTTDQNAQGQDGRLLTIIQRETERLDGMICNFLRYANTRDPMKSPVPVVGVVEEIRSLVQGDARFGSVTFDCNIPDDAVVNADADQLKQILWNLFINAAEAMEQGGLLHVNFDKVKRQHGTLQRKFARIDVRDSGRGIAPWNRNSIFEPFFTTKTDGTGLGLATVYRIVEAHGGFILVDSEVGKGTCFSVFFPEGRGVSA